MANAPPAGAGYFQRLNDPKDGKPHARGVMKFRLRLGNVPSHGPRSRVRPKITDVGTRGAFKN
eukprot:2649815-Lingulodinium_polyedra.AAC.1